MMRGKKFAVYPLVALAILFFQISLKKEEGDGVLFILLIGFLLENSTFDPKARLIRKSLRIIKTLVVILFFYHIWNY